MRFGGRNDDALRGVRLGWWWWGLGSEVKAFMAGACSS